MKYSPGIMEVAFMTEEASSYRLVHGDELGAVGKRRLDLNFRNHFGDAIHHLRAGNDVAATLHQFGDAVAVTRTLENEIGNERHRFRMVELDAALKPPARDHRRHGDQEFVFFARSEVHLGALSLAITAAAAYYSKPSIRQSDRGAVQRLRRRRDALAQGH